MHRPGMISIWFFIGALLLAYGVLICGSGIYEAVSPSAAAAAAAKSNLHWSGVDNLHVAIWWGALLIVLGAIYTIRFAPGKGK
jgi:hypothetical protein